MRVMKRNHRFSSLALILVTVALTLFGCNRKTIYSHYEPTPLSGWEKNDTLSFAISQLMKEGNYLEQVGMRVNADYPFKSITIIVQQHTCSARIIRTDTLHAQLMDQEGNVLGNGINILQYQFPLATVQLLPDDTLFVSIRHGMKREILPGISDIGVSLTLQDK